MRRLAKTLIFAGLIYPSAAFAGSPNTTFTASQENGVIVYRGQASQQNYRAMQVLQHGHQLRAEQAKINARLAAQDRALTAQQQSITDLNARLTQKETQSKPARRSRYGRSYVGNNRFFGPNGFIGNSNFSGATQPLPSPYRQKYQRKHH